MNRGLRGGRGLELILLLLKSASSAVHPLLSFLSFSCLSRLSWFQLLRLFVLHFRFAVREEMKRKRYKHFTGCEVPFPLFQPAADVAVSQEADPLLAKYSCGIEAHTTLSTELELKQAQLAAENERLATSAQTTHRELSDEYARQMELWQEWDAAYHRTAAELNDQLEAIEQRRAAVQTESELLANRRAEVQRLRDDCERDRRMLATERIQVGQELSALQTSRTAFETERQQQLIAVQEREAQLASEQRDLAFAQNELRGVRQQFEQDRTLLASERSSESLRREQEIQNHSAARTRLNDEEASLRTMRFEIDAARRAIEDERATLDREREEFEIARMSVEDLRTKLSLAETERLQQLLALQVREVQLASEQRELAIVQGELRGVRQQFEQDRTLLASERSSESLRREQEIQNHSAARSRLNDEETSLRAKRFEIETARRAIDDERVALDREREEFEIVLTSVEDLRVKLSLAETELDLDRKSLQQEQADSLATQNNIRRRQAELDELQRILDVQHIDLESIRTSLQFERQTLAAPRTELIESFPPEPSSLPMRSLAPVPPPIPPTGWTATASHSIPLTNGSDSFVSLVEKRNALLCESLSNGVTAVTEVTSVEEALTDVNRYFGFAPAVTDDEPTSIQSSPETADGSTLLEEEAKLNPELQHRDDSLVSLRAQLARMFDLNEDTSTNESAPVEPNSEESTLEPDLIGSMTDNASEFSLLESLQSDSQPVDSSMASESSVSASPPESVFIDSVAMGADEEANEPEDEWTRRVRELSEVAGRVESPSSAPSPAAVVEEPASAEVVDEEEYSVEAQLARLLGRPRIKSEAPPDFTAPVDANPTARDAVDEKSLEIAAETAHAREPDRSHLKAEPKHKQNKNAVREEVQSFRAVAQMSARSALAKHSWNNLRSSIYFTTGLTTVSAVAAAWFFGTYLYGSETQSWKGITCTLATIVSASGLFRSHFQMKNCRRISSKHTSDDSTPSTLSTNPTVRIHDTDEPHSQSSDTRTAALPQ